MIGRWRWRPFASMREDHRRISSAALAVGAFIALSRLAGAAREIVIAHRYGAGPRIDAYVFVFNLVGWPVAVWTGVLMTAIVPALVGNRERTQEVQRFREELLGLSLWCGCAAGLACFFVLDHGVRQGAFGLAPDVAAAALEAIPALSLLAPINFLMAMYFVLLLANHRHVGTLLEAVPPFAVIVAIVLFSGGGLGPLLVGSVAGAALQLVLAIGVQKDRRSVLRARFSFASPVWKLCSRGIWVVLLGQALASTAGVVDQLAAATLGSAANATLSYANRLIALATALGATVIARALLPVLCELQVQDPERAGKVMRRWGMLVFGASAAGIAVAWFAAEPGVRLLFQRGAFTQSDTLRVAAILRAGLLQLPPYLTGMVAVQFLTSQMRYGVLLATGVIVLAAKIGLNALLIPTFGLQGVMYSTFGMYLVSALTAWIAALGLVGGKTRPT